MDIGIQVSLALLGFWLTAGAAVYIVMRDRARKRERDAEIEKRLAEWVESERKAGTDPTLIVAQLEEKRREIGAEMK